MFAGANKSRAAYSLAVHDENDSISAKRSSFISGEEKTIKKKKSSKLPLVPNQSGHVILSGGSSLAQPSTHINSSMEISSRPQPANS